MRALLLLLSLFFTLTCFGQGMLVNSYRFSAAGPTYLVKQDFEGTGYDNSETWGEASDPDEDYTTSPAPLVGSQSLRFNGTTQRAISPTFAGQDEIYTYHIINLNSLGTLGGDIFVVIGPGLAVDINALGTLRIGGSVNSARTTDALSTGVTYYIRIRYIKDLDGGGGSAIYNIEFSTTDAFTGSGNKFTQVTTGTDTAQATAIQLRAEGGGTAVDYVADKVRVDNVIINGNPE